MTEKNIIPTATTPEEQRKAKFKVFAKLWVSTAKLNSTIYAEPDENDVSMAFTDLSAYSIEEIKTALAKFRKMPERRLTPAVIESIITGSFWLTADEAWSVGQKYLNPCLSVVVTDEIANAASKVESLYNENQRSAAKAAFDGIYERLMMQAISTGKKPRWFLSPLDDRSFCNISDANKAAIIEAVSQCFISTAKAKKISDSFGCDIAFDGSIKKLLAAAPDDNTRNAIEGLKTMFLFDGGKNGE